MVTRPWVAAAVLSVISSLSGVARAGDGSLGSLSDTSSAVSITVPPAVRISGLDDISIPVSLPDELQDGIGYEEQFCVYDNTATFRITATGSGTANAFEVAQGVNKIAYSVKVGRTTGGAQSTLTPASPKLGLVSAATAVDCGGVDNFKVTLDFAALALQAALSGTYSGTLTLLVAPN